MSGGDLSAYVKTCVAQRYPTDTPSDAVENALRCVRNVVCQRFPRDLMTIDALQRDVLGREGSPVGNYAFFAEQAENLFMPSVLFALDEYGIPIQTARSLQGSLLPASSLDEVLARLGRIDLQAISLSAFEHDILREVQETLFPPRRPAGPPAAG